MKVKEEEEFADKINSYYRFAKDGVILFVKKVERLFYLEKR